MMGSRQGDDAIALALCYMLRHLANAASKALIPRKGILDTDPYRLCITCSTVTCGNGRRKHVKEVVG